MEAEGQKREKEKEREIQEAKERQIFDPVNKVFNYSKRRVTDMKENSKVQSGDSVCVHLYVCNYVCMYVRLYVCWLSFKTKTKTNPTAPKVSS